MLNKNRLFLKNGHECDMSYEYDALWKFFPGNTKWANLQRYFYKFLTVSELNEECKTLLRSQAAILQEKIRHLQDYKSTVHPYSDLAMYWKTVMMVSYGLYFIIFPFAYTFLEGICWHWIYLIEYIILFICWIDIFLNFCVGYRDFRIKEIVLDRSVITKGYLKTYFVFDVVSSIPYVLLLHLANNHLSNSLSQRLELLGFAKFVRLRTFFQYQSPISQKTMHSLLGDKGLLSLVLSLWVLGHWGACLVYFSDLQMKEIHFVPQLFENSTRSLIAFITPKQKYVHALHSALFLITKTKVTATGYLSCSFYMLALCVIIILGQAVLIYYTAAIKESSTRSQSSNIKYNEMVRQLTEYMSHLQLPSELQNRILLYYEFRFRKSYFQESEILNSVTGVLRQEIILHNCRQLVENVEFFKDLPLSLLVRIVSCLKPEIYLANDVIIRVNTPGDAMYFIASGTVAVYSATGREICHLEDGAHFGEVALVLDNNRRIASVVAVESCELYKLHRKHFKKAIGPYPELLEAIQRIAIDRRELLDVLDQQSRNVSW